MPLMIYQGCIRASKGELQFFYEKQFYMKMDILVKFWTFGFISVVI